MKKLMPIIIVAVILGNMSLGIAGIWDDAREKLKDMVSCDDKPKICLTKGMGDLGCVNACTASCSFAGANCTNMGTEKSGGGHVGHASKCGCANTNCQYCCDNSPELKASIPQCGGGQAQPEEEKPCVTIVVNGSLKCQGEE